MRPSRWRLGPSRSSLLLLATAAAAALLAGRSARAQPPPAATEAGAKRDPLSERPGSVEVLAGSAIAIHGVNYNLGVGVRAGAHLAHFYLGGMLAVHQGDTKTIAWGPTAFSNGGDQKYTSHPFFFAADAGYTFDIPIGSVDTLLTPCLSGGLLLMTMDTSGVYGSSSIAKTYGLLGLGASYGVLLDQRVYLGAHFRMYDTGDTTFDFGNLAQGTYEHGFSTSIFYYALYSELGYRF
jgi:hypothetical protein